jgi:hypothetical protein
MMFFGENGNEVGGLVFDGNNGKGQGGSLTFDKFRGDQTIQFVHDEEADGSYFAGLKVSDQNLPLNDLLKKDKEISKLSSKQEQEAAWKKLRSDGLLMTERLDVTPLNESRKYDIFWTEFWRNCGKEEEIFS